MIPVEKNKEYIVDIESVTNEGNGVCRIDGYTVFVPMTAAGDKARIRIVKTKPSYGFGKLVGLAAASPVRTEPVCANFRRCGGCQLMHIDYSEQLKIKSDTVNDALRRIGGISGYIFDGIIGMAEPYKYRNKMIFPIGRGKNGSPAAGFYAAGSHDIVPLTGCAIGPDICSHIIRAVTSYAKMYGISVYDEQTHSGILRRIFIRGSKNCGEYMVVISVNSDSLPHTDKLTEMLTDGHGEITGILLNINKKRTNLVLGEKNILIYGKERLTDVLCQNTFEISVHSFFQVNPVQTEKLYDTAIRYAAITAEDRVMDIYCGIGTISLACAKYAKCVTGIEIVPEAIEDAKNNAAANGISNAAFYAADAADIVPRLIKDGAAPDIVILDPPRKGSDEKTLGAITSALPKRIVYVSCNPATLARDVKFLTQNGYTADRVTAVDMFPHTAHVETVCQLVLRRSPVHINIDVNVEELVQDKRGQATYEQIKAYVLEHSGLKVSSLYIAQIKRKCGIIERENYNKPKSEDARQPQCSQEKEAAIVEALKHFHMV